MNILAAAATCSRRFNFSLQIAFRMEFGVFGVLMTSFPFCRATLLLMDNVRFCTSKSSHRKARVCLKTHDVTGSEGFLRCARHFFAGILTYFKEK